MMVMVAPWGWRGGGGIVRSSRQRGGGGIAVEVDDVAGWRRGAWRLMVWRWCCVKIDEEGEMVVMYEEVGGFLWWGREEAVVEDGCDGDDLGFWLGFSSPPSLDFFFPKTFCFSPTLETLAHLNNPGNNIFHKLLLDRLFSRSCKIRVSTSSFLLFIKSTLTLKNIYNKTN